MSERNDKGSCDKNKWKSTKHIGLYDTESSLLDILKPMYITHLDLENANVDVLTPDEDIINLEHSLKNTDCPLLPNILNELVNTNTQKWHGKNCDDLFPAILSDRRCLSRNATVKELQIICGEIRCCTGRVWYTSNMNKSKMVNSVVKAFGGNTFVQQEKNKRKKRTYNVETLVQACTTVVKVDVYPVQHLQSEGEFFADLVQYDKESHGYPKGPNFSRVLGCVVLINHFKHKSDKNYFLSTTIKSKYEIKMAEEDHIRYVTETSFNHNGMYKNHFFDFPNQLKSQHVRRDDITTGITALRNTDHVQ